MGTTLVVDPGSSSRKYALYKDGQSVLELRFEKTDNGYELCSQLAGVQQICEAIKESQFIGSFDYVAESVNAHMLRMLAGKKLDTIAVRIVAPGTYFQHHAEISDEYINNLKKRESTAPLHIPVILRELNAIKKHYPQVKVIAASDSAFHSEIPSKAREYSISRTDSNQFDIHRFGYHGLSVASVVRRIHSLIGIDPERLICCHIGNGVSVTAVKNGKSVETSMGFSPSSGLPMGSRAGDLDAAALLELMRAKNLRPAEAELYINTSGGLSGIANDSDIRRLLDRKAQNDAIANQALNVFAYNIQKAVAAQTVALGGLDVLVLTATAAVRSSELRSLILNDLAHLGVQISKDRNDLLIGKEGVISVRNSQIKVVVMKTDEMGEIAQVASQFNLVLN